MFKKLIALSALVAGASADLYMHNPRGNNNRCDEQNNDTNNNNRLFDSQNNDAGGYPVPADYAGNPFRMKYYEDTDLELRWTTQHSCGPQNNCEMIFQYACERHFDMDLFDRGDSGIVRNGEPQDSADNGGNTCTGDIRDQGDDTRANAEFGRHESKKYYDDCATRQRNNGLWAADEVNPNQNTKATVTRQDNNNNNEHGFECPEERDYYPYWHPTNWVDIAILTTNTTRCDSGELYNTESQNVREKGYCSDPQHNNPTSCTGDGASWETMKSWNDIYEDNGWTRGDKPGVPICQKTSSSIVNRLGAGLTSSDSQGEFGDVAATSNEGNHQSWVWRLPEVPTPDSDDGDSPSRLRSCVLRMRYNITMAEIPWDVDYRNNTEPGVISPMHQDPYLPIEGVIVRHAVNTDQAGRTFQDRSYVFDILKRDDETRGKTVHNLNRCGKRGNIAQVRNCIEYEMCPSIATYTEGDIVHIQFSGSDFNPAGNDGQCLARTDRTALGQVDSHRHVLATPNSTLFNVEDARFLARPNHENAECDESTYGYPIGEEDDEEDQDTSNCACLNVLTDGAGTPYVNYMIKDFKSTGTFYLKDFRNNNFSNRDQFMEITVKSKGLTSAELAGIIVGSVVGFALLAGCVGLVYAKHQNPDFKFGDLFGGRV